MTMFVFIAKCDTRTGRRQRGESLSNVTTHSNVIQWCCSAADCDNTSNPFVSFCSCSGHRGGKRFSLCVCVLCDCTGVVLSSTCATHLWQRAPTQTHTLSFSLTHTHAEEIKSLKCDHVTLTRTLHFLSFLPRSSPVFLPSPFLHVCPPSLVSCPRVIFWKNGQKNSCHISCRST